MDAVRTVLAVHPGALDVRVWQPLADALPRGVELAVEDLQRHRDYVTAGMDPRVTAPSVETMGQGVAQAIARVRPTVVVGWSFGGVVAQSALADGVAAPPQTLVLLDSISTVDEFVMDDDFDPRVLRAWFGQYLCAKASVPRPRQPIPDAPGEEMLAWFVDAGALRPDTPVAALGKIMQAYLGGLQRNNDLARAHQPRPHRTPTHLIRPEHGLLADQPHLGWAGLTDQLTTHSCPGDHYTIFGQPSVATLLADLLDPSTTRHQPAMAG